MAVLDPHLQLHKIYNIAENRQTQKFYYCMLKRRTIEDIYPQRMQF
jgi:hypothetical protein